LTIKPSVCTGTDEFCQTFCSDTAFSMFIYIFKLRYLGSPIPGQHHRPGHRADRVRDPGQPGDLDPLP